MKYLNKKDGFTLIEMVMVLSVLGIMVCIAVPSFIQYIDVAKKSSCVEIRHNLATELMTEYTTKDEFPQSEDAIELEIPKEMERYKCPSGGKYTAEFENGNITITCSVHYEPSDYKPVKVTESAKKYEAPLNTVLKTLYDNIVAPRLGDDKNHISYVLFNGGIVTSISCYTNESDKKGQGNPNISQKEIDALNRKISKALEDTGYKAQNSGADRIFFDWDGNAISGVAEDGSKFLGIGGQGACASIKFSATGEIKDDASLSFTDDNTGWSKPN